MKGQRHTYVWYDEIHETLPIEPVMPSWISLDSILAELNEQPETVSRRVLNDWKTSEDRAHRH